MRPRRDGIPRVCLCGRPNVGKSTLFNRLLGKKKALVLDQPGVTRDVHRATVEWDGRELELADLAGIERSETARVAARAAAGPHASTNLQRLAREAALEYLRTADLVLFVVDGRAGLAPDDEELARLVRSTGRKVLLVLSKIEGDVGAGAEAEAATLGWGTGIATSAEHNTGINGLKESILAELAEIDGKGEAPATDGERLVTLGVYGRPNVGKSTLVNRILGERRMITSPVAGTTIDTVDTDFTRGGRRYRILDTAGVRRKGKTKQGVEVLSVVQALKSVEKVDVALFVIDGYEGVTDQDEKLAGELVKAGKPVAILVNKWDLCRVKEEEYAERLRTEFVFLDFAPVLFVSAEKGIGLEPLWDLLDEMVRSRGFVAPTAELNRFIELVEGANNPTGVKLYYASQTGRNPPTITFMVSDPEKVHFAYERYLRNSLRERYGWMGSPLRLLFRARKRSPAKKRRTG